MLRKWLAPVVAAALAVAIVGTSATAGQKGRTVVCHFKDHQSDHLGPCSAEEHSAGGRTVTVTATSIKARHGLDY